MLLVLLVLLVLCSLERLFHSALQSPVISPLHSLLALLNAAAKSPTPSHVNTAFIATAKVDSDYDGQEAASRADGGGGVGVGGVGGIGVGGAGVGVGMGVGVGVGGGGGGRGGSGAQQHGSQLLRRFELIGHAEVWLNGLELLANLSHALNQGVINRAQGCAFFDPSILDLWASHGIHS